MGFFKKKRGADIIDFTNMMKRGLISPADNKSGEHEVIDFSSSRNAFPSSSPIGNSNGGDDFLSGLAGAGDVEQSPGPITDSLRLARRRNTESSDIRELRLKIDDNDFKLNNLIEKVREIERKIRDGGI